MLEPHAIALGIAFQLTNFIRDVAEDLRRGRVYLPQESLDQFGVDRDRLAPRPGRRADPQPAGVGDRAGPRAYADAPRRASTSSHPTSQDCLRTAFTLYAEILDEIERADYDVFGRRVSVGLASPRPGRRSAGLRRVVDDARAAGPHPQRERQRHHREAEQQVLDRREHDPRSPMIRAGS